MATGINERVVPGGELFEDTTPEVFLDWDSKVEGVRDVSVDVVSDPEVGRVGSSSEISISDGGLSDGSHSRLNDGASESGEEVGDSPCGKTGGGG